MKVEFLQARLEVAEKEWEKAYKKWMNSKHCAKALDANSMTKMAFLNGQRKLLKELISLETSTSSKNEMVKK